MSVPGSEHGKSKTIQRLHHSDNNFFARTQPWTLGECITVRHATLSCEGFSIFLLISKHKVKGGGKVMSNVSSSI